MKKIKVIFGIISTILGFSFLMAARWEMSVNTRYTWEPPYTQYESGVLMMQWGGVLLLVCGLIDLIVVLLSKKYVSDHIQDIETTKGVKCSKCGLLLDSETRVCPKCKTRMK